MEAHRRRQVTLFVPEPIRSQIDSIRARYNLLQYRLIAAHVTLCRDDEVSDWFAIQARALRLKSINISLRFGPPQRDNNLVYLPVNGKTSDFDELRNFILNDMYSQRQYPHVTLIHPRNGTCSTSEFDAICKSIGEVTISFERLTLIEKIGNLPWASVLNIPTITNSCSNIADAT